MGLRFKALNLELSSALERMPLELMAVSEEVQEQVWRRGRKVVDSNEQL